MSLTGRRGLVLIELLVAVVIGGVVVTLAAVVELRLENALRGRLERAGAVGTLRAVAALTGAELGSLGSDPRSGPDLVALSPRTVGYRAYRGFGAACRLAADSVVLDEARLAEWRYRDPEAGRDSLLIYRPPDSVGAGEGWIAAPIVAGPLPVVCPGGSPGRLLLSRLDSTMVGGGFPSGTVVRWFEFASLGAYAGATGWQFGFTGLSGGGSVQPVAGPVAGPGGIVFALVDRFGMVVAADRATAVVLSVVSLGARELAVGPGRGGPAADSVGTMFVLENRP